MRVTFTLILHDCFSLLLKVDITASTRLNLATKTTIPEFILLIGAVEVIHIDCLYFTFKPEVVNKDTVT